MTAEYDPKIHITAGELRAAGATIPDNIPDCGWVPRSALTISRVVHVDPARVPEDMGAGALPNIELVTSTTEPFRWIEIKGTIET